MKDALESAGYIMVDFDQWGITCLSEQDPDLEVDLDELSDYGDQSRLVLRRGRLSENEIDDAKEYLNRIYRGIRDQIVADVAYGL